MRLIILAARQDTPSISLQMVTGEVIDILGREIDLNRLVGRKHERILIFKSEESFAPARILTRVSGAR